MVLESAPCWDDREGIAMSPFWIAFAVGLFVGSFLGIFIAALLQAGRDR
jgi:hypothetical protein